MAVASCAWVPTASTGSPPASRQGHAIACQEDFVYLFGGSSHASTNLGPNIGGPAVVYYNDLYTLSVFKDGVRWEAIEQQGQIPSGRDSHSMCASGNWVYLYGGRSSIAASECLEILYGFNLGTLSWHQADITDDLPQARAGHTFTAHRNKDIYLFGGHNDENTESLTVLNDLHKLSLAKLKWKKPVYNGVAAKRRYNHTAFVMNRHLYIFGGINNSGTLDDLKRARLLNPSDRKPVLHDLMQGLGVQGHSTEPKKTKKPNLNYEMDHPAFTAVHPPEPAPSTSVPQVGVTECKVRDLRELKELVATSPDKCLEAMVLKFEELQREKLKVEETRASLQQERDAYKKLYRQQQQELKSKLAEHKLATESWMEGRMAEIDEDRKLMTQEKLELSQRKAELLKLEKETADKATELHSIMKQFQGS